MKTININGKEYTKKQLLDGIYRNEHDVSGLFETLCTFPRHEPEPPTVRPMSELPEDREPFSALFVLEDKRGIRYYDIGFTTSAEFASIGNVVYSMEKSWRLEELKILGWLHELPLPNDIKL